MQSLPRSAAGSLKQMSVFLPLQEVLFHLPKVRTFRLYKAANSLETGNHSFLVARRDAVPVFLSRPCPLVSISASKMVQVDIHAIK